MKKQHHNIPSTRLAKWLLLLCLFTVTPTTAQELTDTYNDQRPVIVVCDWDKPPYEFMNGQGHPAGSNIDILEAIFHEMNIPYQFVMKEWGNAIKTFERGEADLILANSRRYNKKNFYYTQNIINYNRIMAATTAKDTTTMFSIRKLVQEGVVLKPSDFSAAYFINEDSSFIQQIEFQSPKVALMGLVAGDYNYFVWGEEPIKWKLKELNIEGIKLIDVNIPISEIHIIGRDKELIDELDNHYSRMKQRGEIEIINNRWFHPERNEGNTSPIVPYIIIGIFLLAVVLYLANRLAKAHVRNVTRESTDLNNMMYKALHMGSFHIMQYDISADLFTNHYGEILPSEGMTLKEFTKRIHPEEQQEFTRNMEKLLNGRERKFELKKRWNAGTSDAPQWLILEGHAIVELDDHGHPTYVINAVNNITHNIEAERNNYEMKKKFEVLSNMPLIATSFYDKDGYLMELNDAMKELCGFDENDASVERFWRKVCMFDVPLFRNAYQPGARNDLYVCQHMEYPGLGVNRFIEFHIHPLFDKQNELTNYLISAKDVTDDHDKVNLIRQNKQKKSHAEMLTGNYRRILSHMTEIGNSYFWKSSIAEQTICFYRTLQKQDDIMMTHEAYQAHMAEKERMVSGYILNNKDADQSDISMVHHFNEPLTDDVGCWLQFCGAPVRDNQGNIIGHHGIFIDISNMVELQSELKVVTQRAKDIGKLKSGFMASMTHELRTPLNAIMGFTDVLKVTDDPKERAEFIRIIRNGCDMLVRLINDIFEASSISEGPNSIEPVMTDFSKAFNDICLMLEQRIMESGLTFLKDNPYDSFPTTIDIGRIQQIITNFVTNAIKFTHEGFIKVGYRYEEGALYIYCEDTGSGIPKEKQGLIFDRFVKLDEYVQGTGLGLTICKSIAERCGGRIGVKSDGEGKGSTFWVKVPCKRN